MLTKARPSLGVPSALSGGLLAVSTPRTRSLLSFSRLLPSLDMLLQAWRRSNLVCSALSHDRTRLYSSIASRIVPVAPRIQSLDTAESRTLARRWVQDLEYVQQPQNDIPKGSCRFRTCLIAAACLTLLLNFPFSSFFRLARHQLL